MFAINIVPRIVKSFTSPTPRLFSTRPTLDACDTILPLFPKRSQMLAYLRKNFTQGIDYLRTENRAIKITPSIAGIVAIRKQHRRPNKEAIQSALSHIIDSNSRIVIKSNIEYDTISVLERAFVMFEPIRQYSVQTCCTTYRIDLYLRKLKVAIECDENGHVHYSDSKEVSRQTQIENELQCTFVRYNPHEPSFNLGDVIQKVVLLAT